MPLVDQQRAGDDHDSPRRGGQPLLELPVLDFQFADPIGEPEGFLFVFAAQLGLTLARLVESMLRVDEGHLIRIDPCPAISHQSLGGLRRLERLALLLLSLALRELIFPLMEQAGAISVIGSVVVLGAATG